MKDGARRTNCKLLCFAENVRSRRDDSAEYAVPKKLECAIPEGEICGLDAIVSASGDVQSVVAAYKDGRVVSAWGDLSQTNEARSVVVGPEPHEVEYSAVLDPEDVKNGILKGREDVLAALDQTGTGGVRGGILCQIVRTKAQRRFELYLLRGHTQNDLQSSKQGLQSIMTFELPGSRRSAATTPYHEVHAASGRVYSMVDGRLAVYDVGRTIPKSLVELGGKRQPFTSFARVSASMVATISAQVVSVHETGYGSVQATGTLQLVAASHVQSKKRKRDSDDHEDLHAPATAISVFSDLGLLVFLSGTQLAAVQLGEEITGRIRGRERPARLTDVLSQGATKRSPDPNQSHDRDDGSRSDWMIRVDKLIENNDIEGLEGLIANDETLGRQRKPETFWRKKPVSDEDVNGDAAAYDDLWPLPEPLDPTKLDRQRIRLILSKVFSYAPDEPQIEVRLASRKLLEWLALTGHLTRKSLEQALQPGDRGVQREPIRPGDIMTAISEIDEEFQLMCSLLSLPARWDLSEVIQALCLLIRSFDATQDPPEQVKGTLSLPSASELNGNGPTSNGDVQMVNGDADSHVESESKAAETELQHVERILMTGLEVRSDTLGVILERFHAFPAVDVTSTMRTMMTAKELVFLIHMLRIELADGGWTSRYIGTGADEEHDDLAIDSKLTNMIDVIPGDGESGPNSQAIRTIGDLLNCAIDAVGTSGWLVGLSGDALGTDDLLDTLRAEVSAGLEGCYEADTLGASLAELEQFVASMPEARRDREEEDVSILLPVGGRAEPTLPKKKSDGRKSKQVLALEMSKKVGKYSLDRIRV